MKTQSNIKSKSLTIKWRSTESVNYCTQDQESSCPFACLHISPEKNVSQLEIPLLRTAQKVQFVHFHKPKHLKNRLISMEVWKSVSGITYFKVRSKRMPLRRITGSAGASASEMRGRRDADHSVPAFLTPFQWTDIFKNFYICLYYSKSASHITPIITANILIYY